MVNLIPSPESVMQILENTDAYRRGHFRSQSGRHSAHYFKIPRAFHFYDNARVLAVALSRKFRMDRNVSSLLPHISVVSPSADGIPVAFSIRDALNAEQIYWATRGGDGRRQFPPYLSEIKINPCIVVDDIIKSGSTLLETFQLLKNLGVPIIGCGAIVKFQNVPQEIENVEIKSLVEFDSPIYPTLEEWNTVAENDQPEEAIVEF